MIRAEWAAGRVMHGEQSCWIGPEGKCFLNSSWAINCQLELYFGRTFDSQTLARNEHSIICSSRYDPEAIATCVLAIASCKERCKESKEYKVLERHLNIIDVLAKLTAMTIWEENVGQEQKTYGVWEKKRLGDASSAHPMADGSGCPKFGCAVGTGGKLDNSNHSTPLVNNTHPQKQPHCWAAELSNCHPSSQPGFLLWYISVFTQNVSWSNLTYKSLKQECGAGFSQMINNLV